MTQDSTALTATEQQPRPKPPVQAGGTISAMIPTDIDQAFRLATAIARSGMTPKAYDNNPDKVFVGILAGAELGLAPFQALQSIAVIGNNPAVWGDGALALVRASGLLEDFEETDDGEEAKCRIVRSGETPIIRTFSIEDAKKAGLAGKAGPWTQYPRRMRQMRARAWALRDGFADVLKGLHIVEEARDRPDLAEHPQPQRLTSDMLANQAGVTVEQQQIGHEQPAETVQDAQVEDVSDDIDGPLDGDQVDEPDPREAIAKEIIAAAERCTTVIDVEQLKDRRAQDISALPDEMAGDVRAVIEHKLSELRGG